jgi:hypothetical protein
VKTSLRDDHLLSLFVARWQRFSGGNEGWPSSPAPVPGVVLTATTIDVSRIVVFGDPGLFHTFGFPHVRPAGAAP